MIIPAKKPNPGSIDIRWKYADKILAAAKQINAVAADYNNDSNAGLSGVQNQIPLDAIPFREDCPSVDFFAGPVGQPLEWVAMVDTLELAEDVDTVETDINVVAPVTDLMVKVGDVFENGSELMIITGITTGAPNYTLAVERGAHGTTAETASTGATLRRMKLGGNWDHYRKTFGGDTTALSAPTNVHCYSVPGGLVVTWDHGLSAEDLKKVAYFEIFYDTSPGVSTADDSFRVNYPLDRFEFTPLDGGNIDYETTYYFRVRTIKRGVGAVSTLSSEVSGKVYSAENMRISTLKFTPLSNNSLSWEGTSGGTAYLYKNGDHVGSISSGSRTDLNTNTDYWIYKTRTGTTLNFTTELSTASAEANVVIGTVRTTSVTTEFCSIKNFWGIGQDQLAVDSLHAYEVEAVFGSLGTMDVGILKCTGSLSILSGETSGDHIILDSSGIRVRDSSLNVSIWLKEAKQLYFESSSGSWSGGSIIFGSDWSIISSAYYGILDIKPQSDNDGHLYLGAPTNRSGIGGARWENIVLAAANSVSLTVDDSAGNYSGWAIEDNNLRGYVDKQKFFDAALGSVEISCDESGARGKLNLTDSSGTFGRYDGAAWDGNLYCTSSGAYLRYGTSNKIGVNSSGVTLFADLLLDSHNTYDIGSSSAAVGVGYFNALDTVSGENLTLKRGGTIIAQLRADRAAFYGHIVPSADNNFNCGNSSYRWADVRSVLINGSDICFDNNWKFREYGMPDKDVGLPPTEIARKYPDGIQLMDPSGRIVAVFHETGFYIDGPIHDLKELPPIQ